MIRFENVSFSYASDQTVLSNMSFEIRPGLTLLLGANGCGKSTLIKVATGVERPDSGRVFVNHADLWRNEAEARMNLAFVPEQPDLTPFATINEILGLVCRLRGLPLERCRDALTMLDLEDKGCRSVRQLSMGQRKKVVLAAAWIGEPDNILLDEPLEPLDGKTRDWLLDWITKRIDMGTSFLVATHDISPFAPLATAAITIQNGVAFCQETLPQKQGERMKMLFELWRH